MRVDGPYGSYSLNYLRYSHIVLVSGGIGVTPAVAMLREVYRVHGDYSNASPLPPHLIKCIHFVWVVKTKKTAEDLFLKLLTDAKEASKALNKPQLFIHIYVTDKSEEGKGTLHPFMALGRPKWSDILGKVTSKTKPGIAFACGPASLVTSASQTIHEHASKNNQRWDFHHEVFDF